MRKISLNILIIVLSATSHVVKAQTTVEVGTGGLQTASYFPLYWSEIACANTCWVTHVRSNALWTQAELLAAGIPNGAIILSIEFSKRLNGGGFILPVNHKVYMANTARTVFGDPVTNPISWASITATHTLVYSNPSFNVPAVTGPAMSFDWIKWDITPFTYTGGTLEIATELIMPPNNVLSRQIQWNGPGGIPPVGDKVIAGWGLGSAPDLLNSTNSSNMRRPLMRISYITQCPAPSPLTINNVTQNSADISWNPVVGATYYQYAISTNVNQPASGIVTTGTNFSASSLILGTRYYVHVRTKCSIEFSAWITTSFNTVGCPSPLPIVTITNQKPGSVEIKWNKVNGVNGYEYAILNQQSPPVGSSIAQTGETSVYASDLKRGIKYYFHIRGFCDHNKTSGWKTIEFHTSGIDAYPNPSKDKVRVTVYGIVDSKGNITVSDAAGRIVRKEKITGNSMNLDINGLAPGIYLIKYESYEGYVTKVIKL